CLQDIQLPLTF
nr:immunoglobulin light chain junction region [Macaca mulatta]MOV77675.1 immunoglobulin light chain junction region [Macaca mulatta]MOV77699.1 immunoglobulin light chain junction region [Macaca mulatta]MOV77857.1 immunoglobulin light chain junction region [Macaca mulatta]MOV78223.1 immunoglobulin light chain junction region [Macaca mulatta]